jgi:hypothetical protein
VNTPQVTATRLNDQITWYDAKSRSHQRWYKSLKVATIALAATIPIVAPFKTSPWVIGVMGALIATIEGVQQLFQFAHNWNNYRSTCEALRHEKYLHEAHAGPYAAATTPDVLPAENVEALISKEHAQWIVGREKGQK